METMKPILVDDVSAAVEKRFSKWRPAMLLTLAGVLICIILAASWAPESQITQLRWVPGWIGNLADRDPNIRTAIPFIPLAFLLFLGFSRTKVKWPIAGSVTVCGLCLVLSELGQRFIPHRTADVKDLLWGGGGIAVGTALAWAAGRRC